MNQPLPLEFRQHCYWLFDGSGRRLEKSAHAKIDHIQTIDAEIPKIVPNPVDQFLARERRNPRSVSTAARAHLGVDVVHTAGDAARSWLRPGMGHCRQGRRGIV